VSAGIDIAVLFEGAPIRVLEEAGDPLFVANDVCAALGVSRTQLRRLDPDEKGVRLTHTLGGEQEVAVVTEAGLYSLILRAKSATTPGTKAYRFRRWVTHEVLPSIRKNGFYGHGPILPEDLHTRIRGIEQAIDYLVMRNVIGPAAEVGRPAHLGKPPVRRKGK
jgi:prophage antirepressor-like protein